MFKSRKLDILGKLCTDASGMMESEDIFSLSINSSKVVNFEKTGVLDFETMMPVLSWLDNVSVSFVTAFRMVENIYGSEKNVVDKVLKDALYESIKKLRKYIQTGENVTLICDKRVIYGLREELKHQFGECKKNGVDQDVENVMHGIISKLGV